jgi:hypothetical protein
MLPLMLLTEVGKRLGFGKQIAALGMKRVRSRMQMAKAFVGYEPTEHDVFVTTFGKSGTNWMMQIAQQISHHGEANFDHIHAVVAWPDAPASGPIPLRDTRPLDQSPTGLRVIKTHLATEYVPYSENSTYLTVLRDPKEVLVSSYYFLGGMFGVLSHVTIDDWFDLCVAPDRLMAAWAEHAASFWDWRNRPNVLVLNFAGIKSEPRKSIERVAAIMGVELTEAQLARVIERASFEYMQAHESQFAPPQSPLGDKSNPTLMVRRGASGKSEELLSLAQQAEVDRVCQAELRRIGSDFPYATEFEVVAAPRG